MSDHPITIAQLKQAVSDGSLWPTVSALSFDSLTRVGTVLADMHNDNTFDGISYFEALPVAEFSNRDRSRIAHVIEGFLSKIRDTTERVVSLVHSLGDSASDNLAYHIGQGFEAWLAANSAQIHQVANIITETDRDSEFLGTVLQAWRATAPSEALNAAISLSKSKWPAIRRQATYMLGAFEYSEGNETLAVERLSDLVSSDDPQNQRAAAFAIIRLLERQTDKSAQLIAKLEEAADRSNENVRDELIAGLAYHRGAFPPPLRTKVLTLMKTVQSDHARTLDLVDAALCSMDIDRERHLVFETLTAILSQEKGAPPLKKFDSLVHKIQTSAGDAHGWYVTHWLLGGEYRICSQLDAFFPPSDKSIYDFQLDGFRLSDTEIFYFAHKIYAYLMFNHGPAVSLLSACLASLKQERRKLLEKDITSFWLRNYPTDLDLFNKVSDAYPNKGSKPRLNGCSNRSPATKHRYMLCHEIGRCSRPRWSGVCKRKSPKNATNRSAE
ncbi:HEAT repeat domain-containing protein [Mesorhizobium sp. M1A.F.Ca.ET.072.01.1.1]|uniref:HEAT repeat domain-containing protein n=1 Tax=Mesorhizobium sp. M1A.F.Ca.ET.072.01.1.1 TaxID=2496753 RepID=UPI000FD2AB46|nr:HEAT repeat domain-containing protein [Mesorhizobium sp. M1A.F.Ca.ET.072.01.1.1]RUW52219.1 HEAT repeat domain-containing protein [Mesorhizobium sp. M1A.F.Ca.ET.072.01.1.1]TIV03101.1 MAG: HEAT repeat domain-containing protein [Mesorhizobium sp.]